MLIDNFDTLFGVVPTLTKIEEGASIEQFFDELFESDGTLKHAAPSTEWPHREALHLTLRGMEANKTGVPRFYGNVTKNADFPLYIEYPKLRNWVEAFAERRGGRVERVLIAALKPQSKIYRHADRGYYFAPRDRYHLVLKSSGSWMRIAGQEETLKEGEVWWINNKAGHESFNDSTELRVHLIIDLYPHSVWRRIKNYLRWIYLGLRPGRLTNYWFNWPKRRHATS